MEKKLHTIEFIESDIPIKMYLPYTNDFIQSQIISKHTFFEINLLRFISKFIDPNRTLLDIGGNIGNHSIYFSKILGVKTVISFEPQKTMQEIFERNMELNGIQNVILNRFPLSDTSRKLSIKRFDQNNFGGTQFTPDYSGKYEARSLDSLELKDVQFVKMDVEEHELNVLKGGEKLFTEQKPILWIEIHKDSPTRNEVLGILQKYGYVCAYTMGEMDYLFIHKSEDTVFKENTR